MELKDRIVIINEKNMNSINDLYGKCTTDELERIINNMIDNAVVEIKEDRAVYIWIKQLDAVSVNI